MISTPDTAMQWLMSIGLEKEQAYGITQSREKFEYFCAVLDAMMKELGK